MFRTISVVAPLVVLASGTVWAQFRTITVQNANTNPVPTTIQNTPNVNVSGGSVGITGTPTVNVGTLPAVQLSGTPGVNVANTPNVALSSPVGTAGPGNTAGVLVKDLDNPARQPFQQKLSCTTTAGGPFFCTASLALSPGKGLVVEYLQVFSNESGGSTASYGLQTIVNGNPGANWIFTPGTRIAPNFPVGEHQVRIYADPGSTVTFSGFQNSTTGTVTFNVLLSGYLVNVP